MPNREIVIPGGAGVYPLTGDVTSAAGNSTVRVTGLQGVTIATPTLMGGENLQYNVLAAQWAPTLRATIQVDSVTVSDDYIITVDVIPLTLVNGS